jgi:predicted metal-dependent phosphoesterase TrpH
VSIERAPSRFELHAHTTCSDGLLTPSGLIEHALARGLRACAVTDHDTVRGHREAQERGAELGIEVIPGIEATCEHRGDEVHILGLFVESGSKALAETFARLRARRIARMHEMIALLRREGVALDAAEIMKQEGAAFGRPHLARALVAAGKVGSIDEAFQRYLAEGRPAYVPKANLRAEDGIAAIRAARGVAVLAHPGRYKREPDLDLLLREGLQGLEVFYPSHSEEDTARYAREAQRLGLIASGGADYHGDPGRRPDLGGQPVPEGLLDELRRAAGRG